MNFQIESPSVPFQGRVDIPGDKSISHRAALLAAIGEGRSTIHGFLKSKDCLGTLAILKQLGINIHSENLRTMMIDGCSGIFSKPKHPLDCQNSGTTLRLLAGILAAQPFSTTLTGDASLNQRPMRRIIEPLEMMGGSLQAMGEKQTPPLIITGSSLHGISYILPIASAQVKSALLLAALFAKGVTTIIEPISCRDHTERLFKAFQINYSISKNNIQGKTITLRGPQSPKACILKIPGDISSAAFWIVAAAAQTGSHLVIEDVGLNPTRLGIITILQRMGACIKVKMQEHDQTEPSGNITIQGRTLRGTTIQGEEIPNVIDELPILAIAGALAQGITLIKNAKELRVKETDRIHALVTNLRALGVNVIEYDDGFEIQGGTPLQSTTLSSFGDHRIAMAFAIAGLFARGKTIIENVDCVATSYPDFETTLQKLVRNF